jgi:DNA-binding XRE family transcriptional regulator
MMSNEARELKNVSLPLPGQLDLSARRIKLYLAQNVTLARHRAGLTQLQLAKAAELSRATVHLIEAGICDARLSTVARLAEALKMNALDLLNRNKSADHGADVGL